MKYIISASTIIIASVIMSCTPKVLFEQAVPPSIPQLESIPVDLCGLYFFESDSNRIMVNENIITTESTITYKTTIAKIKESEYCSIVAGGVHILGQKECYPFTYINEDTIEVKILETDTIFIFSKDQVAKLHDGQLYLNYKKQDNEWLTFVISPDKKTNNYIAYLIDIPNKKNRIKSITKDFKMRLTQDSTEIYIINPSLKEFKKVMRRKNLNIFDKIIPVNLEIEIRE